nr:hypothetical protein [Tanacetum cinerariifolium]
MAGNKLQEIKLAKWGITITSPTPPWCGCGGCCGHNRLGRRHSDGVKQLSSARHPYGLRRHSPTPHGAAVVAVPSSNRYHDGAAGKAVVVTVVVVSAVSWTKGGKECGCCGVVGGSGSGVKWRLVTWGRRVMASGVKDRVDRETRNILGFAGNARRKTFPAAAGGRKWWWLAGGGGWPVVVVGRLWVGERE